MSAPEVEWWGKKIFRLFSQLSKDVHNVRTERQMDIKSGKSADRCVVCSKTEVYFTVFSFFQIRRIRRGGELNMFSVWSPTSRVSLFFIQLDIGREWRGTLHIVSSVIEVGIIVRTKWRTSVRWYYDNIILDQLTGLANVFFITMNKFILILACFLQFLQQSTKLY